MASDFFASILEGVEYFIALGSVIGFLGLFIGIIIVFYGGKYYARKGVLILIISIILLALTGWHTGIKYFRIF